MADMPKISNCPLRDKDSQICMCMNLKCDGEVDSKTCFAIRNAFSYGQCVEEAKWSKELKDISMFIVHRVEMMQSEE